MSYANIDEVKLDLETELGPLYLLLSTEQLSRIVNKALVELGWSLPLSPALQCLWLVNRSKRHAIDMLLHASAPKFKYDQVNLQQRFEHYSALISRADAEFTAACEANPEIFSSVNPQALFGFYSGAGFYNDPDTGTDLTYVDGIKTPVAGG